MYLKIKQFCIIFGNLETVEGEVMELLFEANCLVALFGHKLRKSDR